MLCWFSRSLTGSIAGFDPISASALGWVSDRLVANVTLPCVDDEVVVRQLVHVVLQESVVVVDRAGKIFIGPEVIDQKVQIFRQYGHWDTATMAVPALSLVQLLRDLPRSLLTHCRC